VFYVLYLQINVLASMPERKHQRT